MAKTKALLVILDGWGLGDRTRRDVISMTETPYWDYLLETYPHSELQASGESVGLPDGQMGNSEVGHLNIGAGRVVYQDLVKINRAARDGSIFENPGVRKAWSYARENNKQIHLMGLVSDGGVHSSLEHLFKLTEISRQYGVDRTFVHCFLDGRDTDPKSGAGFLRELEGHLQRTTGRIASVVGRYYAMDRDRRWERIRIAYDLLVKGVGRPAECASEAVEESYRQGVTDEFVKPIVCVQAGRPVAVVEEGDVVVFFNFRNDRAKELTIVLSQRDMPEEGMFVVPGLHYFTMTPYDPTFRGVEVLFDKDNVDNTLGEYLSGRGLKQLHMAETEKYAHVTFFFNGGREEPFAGEERILVASPKVATYDLKPEMSAYEVKDRLVEAIESRKFDLIVVNFANGDMVGHTGVYEAIERAVVAVDACLRESIEAAKVNGYEAVVIADHGNADYALNDDGTPNTAHSLSPVPFVYVSDRNRTAQVEDGRLADVAPSLLHILQLEQPKEMTGHNLIG
jgi:2,3-bisphosphoglycerate-independent phosphoglycerate mutase